MRAKQSLKKEIPAKTMRRILCFFRLFIGTLFLTMIPFCHAEWTKDINCPRGTVYRDLRIDAGREEFCERLLPGSLRVKHGPYRFWFNVDFLGAKGSYTNGRRVGPWKECDRFRRCEQKDYPLADPLEQERTGFKPEVPISFHHGKYVFDFTSCWSTWVTQSGGEDIDLNIGGETLRCVVSYLPEHVTKNGGEGSYTCWVPFSVGRREFGSLDLLHELTKLGLPQFCRPPSIKGDPLMIVNKIFFDIATSVDVQCAAIERNAAGIETLTFRLNRYATDLANEEASKNGPLVTRLCFGPNSPNHDSPTEMVHEPSGGTLFRYRFNSNPAQARKQKKCVSETFELKNSCQ
jgi:hypothetical protein